MTIRTLATGLFTVPEAEWLVPAVCTLARAFDAHLIGVHPVEPMTFYGGSGFEPLMLPAYEDWRTKETAAMQAVFEKAVRIESFGHEFRAQTSGGVPADDFLLESLRCADLVVLGRAGDEQMSPVDWRWREQAIRNSGRPVLVMSEGKALEQAPRRILVGWSPTREAARAAHDALTLVEPGAEIDLLSIRTGRAGAGLESSSREDFAAALDRLGYDVTLLERDSAAGDAGEILVRTARERGADLVVAGAYGHSRAYDLVIGAVTGHLLDEADIPVLLSK